MAHLVDMGCPLPPSNDSPTAPIPTPIHRTTATSGGKTKNMAHNQHGQNSTQSTAAGSLLNLSCEQFQKVMTAPDHNGSASVNSSLPVSSASKNGTRHQGVHGGGKQSGDASVVNSEGVEDMDVAEAEDETPICYLDPKTLVRPSDREWTLIERYLSQRITEGHGEFVLELGSGEVDELGLLKSDLDESVSTLKKVCEKINCTCMQLRLKQTTTATQTAVPSSNGTLNGCADVEYDSATGPNASKNGSNDGIGETEENVDDPNVKWVSDFLIRKQVDECDFIEVRVAVVGNVDAGKSTLLGVLTNGILDDGRGNARQSLFRHKHEMETGRTSSVGNDILGFDQMGQVVNKSDGHGSVDWQVVCRRASKVVTFIDLAGHEKYLKTTIFGMTGHLPDFSMLMVGSNAGVVGMTKEHLGLALALNVPVFVVVTKIDMCPENVLKDTLKLLQRILKSQGCRKIPIFIQNTNDVVVTATNFTSERVCPIFQISNVTGQNLDLLKMFLNLLSARSLPRANEPAEFQIDDIYSVPGVGTVVAGTMLRGTISLNDTLLLGPDAFGEFSPVPIKSIHRKRLPVKFVTGGQTASFALKKIKRNQIRKGMVLVSNLLKPFACWEFEGEILVLHHPTTISVKYQAMVHCCSVRQTAAIVWMDREALRTGDKAKIRFRFIKHPEYLRVGTRLVFREGRTKAVGSITKVYHPSETPQKPNYRNRYAPKCNTNNSSASNEGTSSQGQGNRYGRRRGGARQRRPPTMGANFQNTQQTSSQNQEHNNYGNNNTNSRQQAPSTTTNVNNASQPTATTISTTTTGKT
ncbi:GTP-binding protein 1-like [Symsagittifera roscoffensis]|uniref:GTP-binding protein 1-like n=1 Tax=Symsagittifera roscoffensis TaxID=84072 RepID=UPI00307B8756